MSFLVAASDWLPSVEWYGPLCLKRAQYVAALLCREYTVGVTGLEVPTDI